MEKQYKTYCDTCKYHCAKCDEIAQKRSNHDYHKPNDMLCWCCKHAIPANGNGCIWSKTLKHMPKGVVTVDKLTEYTTLDSEGHKVYGKKITKVVVGCPKFERG